MTRTATRIIWLALLPLAFIIKDIGATMAVLSTEPGITPRASLYYHVALVPGILWSDAGGAMIFNLIFGGVLGLIVVLCTKTPRLWLVFAPPLLFFSRDTACITARAWSKFNGTYKPTACYYAMLPGSLTDRFDPIILNVVIGFLVGLTLFFIARTARKLFLPRDNQLRRTA